MDSTSIWRCACKTLGLRPGIDLELNRFGEITGNISRHGGIRFSRFFGTTLLRCELIHGISGDGVSGMRRRKSEKRSQIKTNKTVVDRDSVDKKQEKGRRMKDDEVIEVEVEVLVTKRIEF